MSSRTKTPPGAAAQPAAIARLGPFRGPAAEFVPAALVFGLPALTLGLLFGKSWPAGALSLGTFALTALIALRGLMLWYPHARLGLCNLVTLWRAAMVGALAAVLVAPEALAGPLAWAIVTLAAVTLALDGLDGWLARSSGLTSAFGARFDMEVDALFALILALAVWMTAKVGPWVLLLGTMRYVYVMACRIWPWLDRPVPVATLRRKTACVIQIATLVALLATIVQPPVAGILAGGALAILTWSFAMDILWLARHRGA
ncbi:MAG: CDP-alcohol phosphatidyltransferase family protein [Rubellimicrobium sp.]|nr:CDP-alcohol phosphatidyltransferase family protein [Rubellimicrobium sp.]